jgi:two-component system sensor histidine kinase/response regulator
MQGKRVLVVDDNKHARQVLGEMLGAMGFNVDQAASGKAAIGSVDQAEASGTPYEIVFLDWQMPDMDGNQTARRLRECLLEHMPHLIMITAFGREEVIKGAEAAGIADVLIKPISASVLFDSVLRALGGVSDDVRTVVSPPSNIIEKLGAIRGSHILLVEDNDLNLQVATELLRDVGFVVDVAENGQVAVDKIRKTDYDIVLMDMQMPLMDGVTATKEIRKDRRFDSLPLVAMTANAMQGDRDRCLAAGMNDHVAKPIEPDDLWKALLKWIKPRRSQPDAQEVTLAAAEADVELPDDIDGLDMSNGLRRVLGKKTLYLSMLHKFVAGQKTAPAEILAALTVEDWTTAERLAHTVKGVAGNIGANVIQQLAEKLESAIKERQPREAINERLDDLQTPLAAMVEQLEQRLPDESHHATAVVGQAKLKAVCDRLQHLLSDDDAEAVEFLDAKANLLNADLLGVAFPDAYATINDGIRSFDFDKALAALRNATGASA